MRRWGLSVARHCFQIAPNTVPSPPRSTIHTMRANSLRTPSTALLVTGLMISSAVAARTRVRARRATRSWAPTPAPDAPTPLRIPARLRCRHWGGLGTGATPTRPQRASTAPIHDAALPPDALTVPDPAPVACGSPATADAAEDGSAAEADGSGDSAAACDFPPSVCADADWLVYFENPTCLDGYCHWEKQFMRCVGASCVNGTCRRNITAK